MLDPPILSLNRLGWTLGIPRATLEEIAVNAVQYYHPFLLKRKGKKTRRIDHPDFQLRNVQRKIYIKLLKGIDLPEYLHGGVKRRSPYTNAKHHLGRRMAVRLDLKDFYPSVTDKQVYRIWKDILGCSTPVASLLTALTTYHKHLPQGAPTSPSLANLVLFDADRKIHEAAAQAGCSYTRYVDDLVFSGDRPQDLIEATLHTLKDSGFRASRQKLSLKPAYRQQEVTGLSVNSRQRPSISRHRRDQIKVSIHQLGYLPRDNNFNRIANAIRGSIAYISLTNPGSARTLLLRLENVVNGMTEKPSQREKGSLPTQVLSETSTAGC